MPVSLPYRAPQVRRLSWRETVRFLVLVARVRWLDWRLHAASRHDGSDEAGDRLLALARRWLEIHAEIGALLGIPEPPHVAEVRTTLQPIDGIRKHAEAARLPVRDRPFQG